MNRRVLMAAGALVIALSTAFYVECVLVPYQQRQAELNSIPRGNLSDLYPRWLGARELFLRDRSPYSPEITREIQAGYYGRALDPNRSGDPTDQQAFAYPVYVVFLLWPTVGLPFSSVQTGFGWFLAAITALSIPCWFSFLRWRPHWLAILSAVLLTLGSFGVAQGIKLQQLSLFVAALIAFAAFSMSKGALVPAGILLGIATIKPQLALPIAGWLLLWAFSDWRRRRAFVFSLGGTLAILLAASEWILPGWMISFRGAVMAYREYTGGGRSLLDLLAGATVGHLLAGIAILIAIVLCWRSRRAATTDAAFYRATSLVLTTTVVIVPMIAPYNQLLLIPSIFLLVREWPALVGRGRLLRFLAVASAFIVIWPWLMTLLLMSFSAVVEPAQVQQRWELPVYTLLLIPLAVLILQLVSIGIRREVKMVSS